MSFETATLDSLCELVVDCPHSTPKWTDEGIIVLRNQNIKNGVLDLSAPSFTNEEDYLKRIKRAAPKAGDIVFTREAPMGEVCMIPEGVKCCLGQRQVLLRPKPDVNGQYLFWALQSPYVQQQIAWNEGTGSTVSNVRIPVLKALNIPRIGNEDMVAKSLSDIASKMALNTQTNQTLEQMAQAIFKSWFVDFDPVKAKMNGEQPEGMDEATVSLFPEKLVESELGLIPDGWAVGTLSDVAKYCSARTSIDGVTVENYISTENMLADKKGVTAASKLPTAKTIAAYKTGDILVSNIRPYFKKIWLAEGNGGRSNDVLGFESSAPNTDSFLMNLLYQDSFFEYMTRTSKGAKMPRGDKTAIMNWEMAVPPVELREAFSTIVDKFYKLIPQNRAQNETLESLRDTLLPKLLSGEIELGKTNELAEVS